MNIKSPLGGIRVDRDAGEASLTVGIGEMQISVAFSTGTGGVALKGATSQPTHQGPPVEQRLFDPYQNPNQGQFEI